MKGQTTIIAMIMFLVGLIVLAALAPLYQIAMDDIVAGVTGTMDKFLGSSIFIFVLISFIISILGYAAYQRYMGGPPQYLP